MRNQVSEPPKFNQSDAEPAVLDLAAGTCPPAQRKHSMGNRVEVRLHRSTPFNDTPTGALPSFVTSYLDGADLVELRPDTRRHVVAAASAELLEELTTAARRARDEGG